MTPCALKHHVVCCGSSFALASGRSGCIAHLTAATWRLTRLKPVTQHRTVNLWIRCSALEDVNPSVRAETSGALCRPYEPATPRGELAGTSGTAGAISEHACRTRHAAGLSPRFRGASRSLLLQHACCSYSTHVHAHVTTCPEKRCGSVCFGSSMTTCSMELLPPGDVASQTAGVAGVSSNQSKGT